MALGTAAALLAGSVISAGVGAASSSSAANKAANASQYAADQSAQVQREALQLAQQNTEAQRAAGNLATNALAARFGLIPNGSTVSAPSNIYAPSGGGVSTTSPAETPGNVYTSSVPYSATTPQAGSPDWNVYLQQNPDVAAAVNGPTGNQYAGATAQERAADHYARYGQSEGRALPTVTPQQAQAAAPVTDVVLSPQSQVPTYTRPDPIATPNFTRPEYTPTLNVSYEDYLKSGDAKAADFDIAKQGGQVQASLAAQGLLNSGAALKRLQEVGQDNKVKYFNQFRDYTTGQYNTDRARFDSNFNYDTALAAQNYQYNQNRQDNIFNLDRAYGTDLALNNRNYETGRYDTQTGNLFNLANLGAGAAASYTGAAQNSANAQSQNLFSNAANQGNAALAGAANLNNLLNAGIGAAAYYYGNKGVK